MENFQVKVVREVTEAEIITHGGVFHGDDVMATAVLAKLWKQRGKNELKVYRSIKTLETFASDIIVYDVGGGRFDHHTKELEYRENGVPYSSVGLIWREFGDELLKDELSANEVWQKVDEELIQPLDAVDNGQFPRVEYPVQPFTVSNILSGFNPTWEQGTDFNAAFVKAVAFAETVFENALNSAIALFKAPALLNQALDKSLVAEGKVMVLDRFLPFAKLLPDMERKEAKEVLYVVFPGPRGGYNWQVVPTIPSGTEARKRVPKEWWGAGKELPALTGVEGFTFCHQAGFLGNCTTKEEAIRVVTLAAEA